MPDRKKSNKKTKDADIIILTDSFRLSHRFFRKTNARFIQILWGIAPNYMGDSAGFWVYAKNDRKK